MTSMVKLRILKNLQGRYTLKVAERSREEFAFFRYNFEVQILLLRIGWQWEIQNHVITFCAFNMSHSCKIENSSKLKTTWIKYWYK